MEARPRRPVRFKVFRGGMLTSWDKLFSEVAEFASFVGAERVISISHSDSDGEGIITVWYVE